MRAAWRARVAAGSPHVNSNTVKAVAAGYFWLLARVKSCDDPRQCAGAPEEKHEDSRRQAEGHRVHAQEDANSANGTQMGEKNASL
mmetsp:Transcript_32591/g.71544  ORF Transcript_32591/g.71544 Transcript_32591/m.71544 type:complete len:86 (-) Transcript_32591:1447-1704(-)